MLHDESDSDDSFSADEVDENNASPRTPTTVSEGQSDQPGSVITLPSDGKITSEPKAEGGGEEAGKNESEDGSEPQEDLDKGDPEMAPVYLKRLLPVFTELFHSSLAPPLRSEFIVLVTEYGIRVLCMYMSV